MGNNNVMKMDSLIWATSRLGRWAKYFKNRFSRPRVDVVIATSVAANPLDPATEFEVQFNSRVLKRGKTVGP